MEIDEIKILLSYLHKEIARNKECTIRNNGLSLDIYPLGGTLIRLILRFIGDNNEPYLEYNAKRYNLNHPNSIEHVVKLIRMKIGDSYCLTTSITASYYTISDVSASSTTTIPSSAYTVSSSAYTISIV